MENPLIKELREALALSAGYRSENHPGAEAVVITSQASVQAVLKELDLLRATPGSATEIHILDNGCQVTGERAANLLDDERLSHEATRNECRDLTAQRDRALAERQKRHLECVRGNGTPQQQAEACAHHSCPECVGTGIKSDGTQCIHFISCPCPRCTPRF